MKKIWLCLLDGRVIKGVSTYGQAFEWMRGHEQVTGPARGDEQLSRKRVIELMELEIETTKSRLKRSVL